MEQKQDNNLQTNETNTSSNAVKTIYIANNLRGETKSSTDLANLDKFLENEKNNNANEPWSKLDKTAKTKKLLSYAENYKTKNDLTDDEYSKLVLFLRDCLDRKKLQRVKDVVYDKTTGEVKDVPALFFNKPSNHFTLKNIDKRVSTTRSLAPKKTNGTIKNVTKDKDSESDSEDI